LPANQKLASNSSVSDLPNGRADPRKVALEKGSPFNIHPNKTRIDMQLLASKYLSCSAQFAKVRLRKPDANRAHCTPCGGTGVRRQRCRVLYAQRSTPGATVA
jgi:hypothetical protein